jgi:hypothetical protein
LNYTLLGFAGIGILLLVMLVWLSLLKLRGKPPILLGSRQEREWGHISYLPYIKQALASTDLEFLRARGSGALAKRVQKERRRIALSYLAALRIDFKRLVRFARVVAAMSPDIDVAQELQGLRLQIEFFCRHYLIYFRVLLEIAPSSAIGNLSDMVSALTVRMEKAISELGERAAMAAELSPYNERGMGAS